MTSLQSDVERDEWCNNQTGCKQDNKLLLFAVRLVCKVMYGVLKQHYLML